MNKFANILFAGKCNAFCPDCIGKQLRKWLNIDNLNQRPLQNIDRFVDILNADEVKEISLTWTITDPLIYKHQERLINHLRDNITDTKLSIHTNGRLIKKIPEIFNLYDRGAISIPSFDEDIYRILMWTSHVPDLENIYSLTNIPIKISALVNDINAHDIPNFIKLCHEKWVKRLVLRKLYGDSRRLVDIIDMDNIPFVYSWLFMNNDIYKYGDMQVTLREFENTENISYNLFADWTISDKYLLDKA